MSDSGRKDEGGEVTRVDRPNPRDVDRTGSTVVVPASKRAPNLPSDATSSSVSEHDKQNDSASGQSPHSLRAVNSFRSASLSSGTGPTRPPGSLRTRAFPVVGWAKYEPVDFIGEGGMGRVYKVRDPVLQRQLALKFIRDEDERLIRRFLQEAQAQARAAQLGVIQGIVRDREKTAVFTIPWPAPKKDAANPTG